MRRSFIPVSACSLMVLLVVGLWGCGGDDPAAPAPETGPDWPETDLSLPAADAVALAAAADRWEILRQSRDLSAARTALVAELNDGWPDVGSAEIASDGYTVSLRFSDGAMSFLGTDEHNAYTEERPAGTTAAESRRSVAVLNGLRSVVVADKSGCADAMVPPSPKVNIVNTLSGTDWTSRYMVGALREFFESAGWDPEDIDYTIRSGLDDTSFTPDSLFHQYEYGIVIFIAGGGVQADAQGEEHFYMQCFTGGDAETYEEHVGSRRWEEYLQWYQSGELISGEVWSYDQQGMVEETWIRGDRLAEEMRMLDGTMVGFVSPNSTEFADEMLETGAGGVMGWDGNFLPEDVEQSLERMGEQLQDGGDVDFASLITSIQGDGFGYSEDEFGNPSEMSFSTGGGDYYLPATINFEYPESCQPPGVAYYDVEIRYPDCPELNDTWMLFPGAGSLHSQIPVGAEIYVEARNEDEELLDTGLWNLDLDSGSNTVEICPCDAELDLNLSDYPQEGPYAASYVEYAAYYGEDGMPYNAVDLDVSAQAWTDLDAGTDVIILATAFNADGVAVGYEWGPQDLRCGRAPWDYCFGWMSVSAGNYPTETAEIVVSSSDEDVVPSSVSFAIGEEASLYGCIVGGTYDLEAEAFNSLGVSLGTTVNHVTVGCGATEIALDFAVYGILMEVSPYNVTPDGVSTSTVTATLRDFQEGDLLEPTGDPRPDVVVSFDTSLGFFIGPTYGITDAGGEASVELASNVEGLAVVRAFVMADGVEPVRPAYVSFGGGLEFWLDSTSRTVDGEFGYDGSTFLFNGGTGLVTHNGAVIHDSHPCNIGGFFMCNRPAAVGDTLRFVFEPAYCDPVYDEPAYVEDLWLHYFWRDEYSAQITQRVFPAQGSWTSNINVMVILEDPAQQ